MITVEQLKARRQVKLQQALALIEIEIIKSEDRGLRELKVSVESNISEVEIAYVLKCAGYSVCLCHPDGEKSAASYLLITWT